MIPEGKGRQISEFKTRELVYRATEFKDSQIYTDNPCLNKTKQRVKITITGSCYESGFI